ncbi:DMT family transporter [Rhodobacter calidifons]|uniref:DMT family transporter n=1 Tax=Rhodobacter calidifons TaxID=2715277 RepID=A0ABX0G8H2_9RHOB|nr:DMT family transporter [Rhodobacter calidifons]NHB77464.1 DMT family transporter [Rhodobacter calidifons]
MTHRPLAAALWMTGAIAAFTAMAIATRQIKGAHDTFEILAFRSMIGWVIVLAAGLALGQLGRVRTDRLGSHLLRNLFHFTGQSLWFWAITLIPLAQVFALEFTSPIWVILLSPLFLGERLTRRKLAAAALGFAGVLIVARPGFASIEPGVIAAAGAAVFFAATTLMTKALTRGEAIISILFWLTLMQAMLGSLAMLLLGPVALPTAATLPWLGLIAVAGIIAHLCLTTALSLAPASVVVPVDFARLPIIAAVGALFYAEPIEPALFLGAGLIFLGIWLTLKRGAPGGASAPQGQVVTKS